MFKGGLEKEASVHAMNFNLLLALVLPFCQGIIWFSFFPPLHRAGGEKVLIICKC